MGDKGAKATQQNSQAIKKSKPVTRTQALASRGIRRHEDLDIANSAVFSDVADGRADFEATRLMLSAIGKKIALENLKVRAGFYKDLGEKGFFLS